MQMTVVKGSLAPTVLKKKEHPEGYKGLGDSMFTLSPMTPMNVRLPENSEVHEQYKEVAYLDADGIDDYTLVEDDEGMLNGMAGTRIPRTNAGNTGGMHLRDNDPWGQLFLYGTEDEEWLEES